MKHLKETRLIDAFAVANIPSVVIVAEAVSWCVHLESQSHPLSYTTAQAAATFIQLAAFGPNWESPTRIDETEIVEYALGQAEENSWARLALLLRRGVLHGRRGNREEALWSFSQARNLCSDLEVQLFPGATSPLAGLRRRLEEERTRIATLPVVMPA